MKKTDFKQNDFSKFSCFVKGTVITAEVIQKSGKVMRNEMKMHFNRILNDCQQFEKELHRQLGTENAENEDDVNSAIVGLVWDLFDMDTNEREQFIEYINNFEPKKNED
jgi:hypothetical protein